MWEIQVTKSEHTIKLMASREEDEGPYVSQIELTNDANEITFAVVVYDTLTTNLFSRILNRIQGLFARYPNLPEPGTDTGNPHTRAIAFVTPIATSLYLFNTAMNIINEYSTTDFEPIRSKLAELLDVDKPLAIQTQQEYHQGFVDRFEKDAENTMEKSVLISARASEGRLRVKYKTPNPNYGPDSMYNAQENSAIQNLTMALEKLCNDFVKSKYLRRTSANGFATDIELTEASKQIILGTHPNKELIYKTQSRRALNAMTALQAVTEGVYATNIELEGTGLHGYGLRNLLAVLWRGCQTTSSNKDFVLGVTYQDALDAMAAGIANGVRGKNRDGNNETIYDDLKVASQECDVGKYNALLCAFNGILKEVEIRYSCIDVMLIHLKAEIIKLILQPKYSPNLASAELLLDTWFGRNNRNLVPNYTQLVAEAKSKFEAMIANFARNYCAQTPDLTSALIEQIKKVVAKVDSLAHGYSYIETVTPDVKQLREEWYKLHPQPIVRMAPTTHRRPDASLKREAGKTLMQPNGKFQKLDL